MYRQYENPGKLEAQLKELQEERTAAVLDGDEDRVVSLDEDIAELKDRINFAYQDEEYDENEAH